MPPLEIRYALRSFRKSPGLVAIAVLSLGLGIGANTAIFSLIDQLLLRALPVREPQRLVQMAARGSHYGSNWGMNAMSYPMYKDFRDQAAVFDGVLCRARSAMNMGFNGQTERINGEVVSGNYFQVLGVGAAIGRTFTPEDDQKPGAHPLAMLTYSYWQSRFAGDPTVLGRTIHMNSVPMTVIGVSQAGFQGVELGEATQVFVPIMMQQQMIPTMGRFYTLDSRRARWVNVFARLKPGVSIVQAKAAVQPLYRQILQMEVQEAAFRNASEFSRKRFLESTMDVFEGSTGRSYWRRQFTTPLYVLMGLTGLVLVIACANVANLLIARATARQKEIAIRVALGAGKGRIVAQLLTESLLLAGIAGGLGLLFGAWTVGLLLGFFADGDSVFTLSAAIDRRVLGFTLGVSVLTALLFGLAPALQAARHQIAATLKNEAGGVVGGFGSARLRKALVVAQVSLSVLLLIASALFVRSLSNLKTLDPGFRIERLVTFALDPNLSGYTKERSGAFLERLLAEVRGIPGVESASFSALGLIDGNDWDSTVTVEGYEAKQGEDMNPNFNAVQPNYFATAGIPFVAGRDFTELEAKRDKTTVCIVNETFAQRYFKEGGAVGKRIGRGGDPGTKLDIEIIGVVKDAKYESMREAIPRQVFVPNNGQMGGVFYARVRTDPAQFFAAARTAARNLDANVPLHSLRTLEQQVDKSLVIERLIATLSAAFGILATALAVIGLYGVMAFTVARRSREIGIRLALGARTASVVGMVMQEVGLLVGLGVLAALPLYFGLARYVRSQLFGIAPTDAVTVVGAIALLAMVALLAGYLPARRAAAVDPIQVLRYE